MHTLGLPPATGTAMRSGLRELRAAGRRLVLAPHPAAARRRLRAWRRARLEQRH